MSLRQTDPSSRADYPGEVCLSVCDLEVTKIEAV